VSELVDRVVRAARDRAALLRLRLQAIAAVVGRRAGRLTGEFRVVAVRARAVASSRLALAGGNMRADALALRAVLHRSVLGLGPTVGIRAMRGAGIALLIAGSGVLLSVANQLWLTGFETQRHQRDLAQSWVISVPGTDSSDETLAVGEDIEVTAFAALWFTRDGRPVVADDVIYVVEGVHPGALRAGPGHYPGTDVPGGPGNVAIAGHRTTYGAPFATLDELQPGDMIHVMDVDQQEWVYEVTELRVVRPTDVWVIQPDALGTGTPLITLTTCHPRGSDNQRLVAWGELIGPPRVDAGDADGADLPLEALPET
jgi:sortase A